MKNFIQPGNSLDLIAPAGGVVSGQGYLHDNILLVANETKAVGESYAGDRLGVHELDKLAANVMTEGLKVNWNDTNKEWQIATSDLDGAGTVVEAAGNGILKVKVVLTPV